MSDKPIQAIQRFREKFTMTLYNEEGGGFLPEEKIELLRDIDHRDIEEFLATELLNERERIEKQNDIEMTQALEERDYAEDWADQLANDIAAVTGIDIGEHSNLNQPWQNALEALHQWDEEQRKKLAELKSDKGNE